MGDLRRASARASRAIVEPSSSAKARLTSTSRPSRSTTAEGQRRRRSSARGSRSAGGRTETGRGQRDRHARFHGRTVGRPRLGGLLARSAVVNSATELARELVARSGRRAVSGMWCCAPDPVLPHWLTRSTTSATRPGCVQLHVRHDERVAGFTALGHRPGHRRPAAVVTTSGTAVANLHPAVLEAHHGRVPLLVLSRRPTAAAARHLGQPDLRPAGRDVRRRQRDSPPTWARTTRPRRGVARPERPSRAAQRGERGPGPVHLNLGFDEPLVPAEDDAWWRRGRLGAGPARRGRRSSRRRRSADRAEPRLGPRAGPSSSPATGPAPRPARFAERLGLPLLAEPTSGRAVGPNAVGPYRLLLDRPDLGGRIERVVVFGRPTLSRPVTRLLARSDVEVGARRRASRTTRARSAPTYAGSMPRPPWLAVAWPRPDAAGRPERARLAGGLASRPAEPQPGRWTGCWTAGRS